MSWTITDTVGYAQRITDIDTVAQHPIGTVVRARHATYGEAEFIYLPGVVGTVAGDAVIYDLNAGTTTRAVSGSRGQVAVAVSANVASRFGWYAISGLVPTRSATAVNNALAYVTASAGQLDDAVSATNKIDGAVYRSADGTPSAGLALVQLSRPALNGNG